MAEYLAPGVYVEEVSFRTKPIEGVSTSTAGFVGPARYGPTSGEPVLVTSQPEFERIFGGLDQLVLDGVRQTNHLAQAVRAFFANGGRRVYISRVYTEPEDGDGRASSALPGSTAANPLRLVARFPGRAGNMRVTLQIRLGPNVNDDGALRQVVDHDTVYVSGAAGADGLYNVVIVRQDDGSEGLALQQAADAEPLELGDEMSVRPLTLDVDVERPIERPRRPNVRYEPAVSWTELRFHPAHTNSLLRTFEAEPALRTRALNLPFVVEGGAAALGAALVPLIMGDLDAAFADAVENADPAPASLRLQRILADGSDGSFPGLEDYEGTTEPTRGLRALEDIEDIAIVAAPGYSTLLASGEDDDLALGRSLQQRLLAHCDAMRYRIAVLDSGPGFGVPEVRAQRGRIDSVRGALYYPWLRILDPITEEELDLPPSGFVTGIYARNDVERGVHKAPANEVVTLAINLETLVNKGQQDVLNPEGINCFRFFEGRGFRLWGARLISSDPEWKYVSDRRYFNYVERSVDRGTQWAVFEPNGPDLWSKVRRSVEEFLFNEWANRHLLGNKPDQAFFVRCDRSTMTQNDLDNGRLVCLIGIAILKPAEFVIFRIGQWTADASRTS